MVKNLNNNDIPLRLKLLRETLQQNSAKFARNIGIPRSTYVGYENDIAIPANVLIAISEKFDVSTNWLLTGMGDIFEKSGKLRQFMESGLPTDGGKLRLMPQSSESTLETVSERGGPPYDTGMPVEEGGITAVPEKAEAVSEAVKRRVPVIVEGGEKGVLIPVIGQGLSAGLGFDYDEGEVVRFIKIPAWIARKSRDLVALPIYGDSMEPTVSRGDLAVCDSGGFKDDGIYVLRDEDRGLMFCKRVIWMPGGWTIMSDNPRYGPMKVDDKAIQVVARVIAAIKEVK